ncbi:2',3'-cyclic-nucleotide 2'-phosphodiesterase/3'-nucleotidase [Scopulibacillus darangshiensis]|uniref:2',3'-cyclic-nucleotide 2'-phosphodiesterase/3'-nucleotidase n=1 Tax=Scopulibacillus darangshiensis TaxID=442528 RepID=A0A4R2NIF7_9BACL|nr:bifunctional UDP-sugar hydrolase/5'-nucleotidase [Scopulibacillus darangshiensis]TCP20975.1 2',3'-cyclic-nucleotide 2'-phosphodiesterase/3'-nucleotidase [Scopulibacillus darangshiensis]
MEKMKLIILETSDVHGNIYPINYGTNGKADVGMGKAAALIKRERDLYDHVMLIDNGDMIQGTPLMYHYARIDQKRDNPMVLLANDLHYDAAVFGNHEFNYGQEVLLKAVKESSFPWLSANILEEDTRTPFYGKPYIVKAFANGLRVGVLGLTTHYIPNWEKPEHLDGMVFEDAVVSAKKWVKYLREEEKADIVVVAYHGGFERDLNTGDATETLTGENQGYQLCQEVSGIDVLLTGHQHRQIADKVINGVIVVQPGNNGIAVGKVSLDIVKRTHGWEIVSKSSELLSVNDVEADCNLLEKVKVYEEGTQKWLDQPIGKIEGDMAVKDPMAIRIEDNPLIEFINRVQMETAGVAISNTALFDNHSRGFPEHVTMRDVVSNYIYPNTLKVIRISGQDIKDALERSASYFKQYDGGGIEVSPSFTTPKPQHYNYDMWEGIDYLIDISKPAGERIVKLDYQGAPLAMDKEYDVVMNNYRSGGGGEYLMYKDKPVIKDIPIDVSELIANYILEKKVVKATVDQNWKVIY